MLSSMAFIIVEIVELAIAVIHVNIIYRDVYSDMFCCDD